MQTVLRGSFQAALAFVALTLAATQAQALDVASQISRFQISKLTSLPKNSAAASDEPACGAITSPRTPAGQKVAGADWIVTGEETHDSLTLVSFVGETSSGTSGSCLLTQGNIGIFQNDALQALIYADASRPSGLGSVDAVEGNRIRIFDGDYLPVPVADLRIIDNDLLILSSVAERDSFCDGKATAPNVYGLPIHLARRLLLAEGWQPAPNPPDAEESVVSGYVEHLRKTMPEVQECSGTGFGFCSWEYRKDPDQALSLTTAGEAADDSSPQIVSFTVGCGLRD
ncbi:hypothetical protein [Paracoccus sulfuroxidans]|uniref:Uncharacterized protein n=1 Tax=Paracoccus sulfuroxidans TaxID=384678 RepID=A0A562NPD8_9RHOB|nr:hypothetical protein [Paracoccus sulfuroxidans]TWI33940.1 hypothetical protein IQ24_02307 [Paracoccus sulfuroxidans]